jgi:hypothetical protein
MGSLDRLLSSDPRETLQFFFSWLRDVTSGELVDEQAMLYNASVLAHFASTSSSSCTSLPTPTSLVDVFDRFVLDTSMRDDPEMLEMAAGQCLLLTGFFGDQLQRRHNIAWYSQLGAGFYAAAAAQSRAAEHQRMMSHMAGRFEYWRGSHLKLSRELREQRYRLT